MSDRALRDAQRDWRARPDDESLGRALTSFERAGRDPPWDLLAASPRWRRHVGFVRKWFERPLEAADGLGRDVIDAAEQRLGVRLPSALREAYLLLGHRDDVLGGASAPLRRLLSPAALELSLEVLVVFNLGEEDGARRCLRLDEGSDPPALVGYWNDAARYRPVGPFSDFLLAQLLWQRAANDGDHFSQAEVRLDRYPRLPVTTWYHFDGVVALHGDADTIAALDEHHRGGAHAATRTPEATARLLSDPAWLA